MRFRFIEENSGKLPISRLCQIMNVSSRGYRAYRNCPITARGQRVYMVLLAHIKEQFNKNLCRYERPRMTQQLKELGFKVGHRHASTEHSP